MVQVLLLHGRREPRIRAQEPGGDETGAAGAVQGYRPVRGVADRYEYVLQSVKEIGFKWREYESEDTVRFWALRLQEAGLIKTNPKKIIAQGTDWRFIVDLKRELKG